MSGAEAGAEILDPAKSVEALLCFEQSRCVRLPFIWAEGKELHTSPANLRLMANDLKASWTLSIRSDTTPQQWRDMYKTGRKQGGLQTTYPVPYTVFLNCLRETNPHLYMLDGNDGNADTDFSRARISPALTPSSQSPRWYLCTIPRTCSQRAHHPPSQGQAGEGHLPYCLGSSTSAETSLSDLLKTRCMCTAGVQGERGAEFSGRPGGWLRLQASVCVGKGQQGQAHKWQW